VNALTTDISLHEEQQVLKLSSTNPELESLLQGCLANDRGAQEKLYKKYYGKMMGMCMRYLRNADDAVEVLNAGFLKVFQNLHRYNRQGLFEAWLYSIVRNAIIDQIRSRVKHKEETLQETHEQTVGCEPNVLQQLYAKDLLELLQQLPETSRLVFNMFAIEGFKHDEIASILGISTGTSKWHVSEARRILKESLEQDKSVTP
jgi:RNA polymerase sigma-70 factor (ECF subfamily)